MESSFGLRPIIKFLLATTTISAAVGSAYFTWDLWRDSQVKLSASIAEFNVYRPPHLSLNLIKEEIGSESLLFRIFASQFNEEAKLRDAFDDVVKIIDDRLDVIYRKGSPYTRIVVHNDSPRPVFNVEIFSRNDMFLGRALIDRGGLSEPKASSFGNRLPLGTLDANEVVTIHWFGLGQQNPHIKQEFTIQHESGIGVIAYDAPVPSPFIQEHPGMWWYIAHWELVLGALFFGLCVCASYALGRLGALKGLRNAKSDSLPIEESKLPRNSVKRRERVYAIIDNRNDT